MHSPNLATATMAEIDTAQKMEFPADLVTFTEEILNGKLHFCAVRTIAFPQSHLILQ